MKNLATWVTHFRITEELLKTELPVSKIEFLVGNIGPDCGLIGEDGKPTPPKETTHFEIEGKINSDSFYQQYLCDEKESSLSEFSYYLGYYIHLVTDEKWIAFTDQKKKEKVFEEILNTPEYTPLVKRDWYGLDFLYLKNHKDNIFWTKFQHINDFPEYLDFFPQGQTLKQIRNITNFYQNHTISDDHEFIYLKANEGDEFVEDTVQTVKELLNQRMRTQLA
ncbi:zinc dependent phospholipase C family protein [Niallia sp. Marseille-Q9988]